MEYSAEISHQEKYTERWDLDVMSEKPEDYVAVSSISEKDAKESCQRASEILGAIQNYIQENF
ncbi:MAG TPA: hypothetical protein PKK05_12820 [Leptospiraceae bacterium]|nr:hypothetical protein [Leptospiraceae bacterium]